MSKSYLISTNNNDYANSFIIAKKQELGIAESNFVDYCELKIEKTQSISIDKVKTIKSWANNKPYQALHKLCVIWQAELLTVQAQNSLLKQLEEPNASTSIVLVTKNYKRLLQTIISRCELLESYIETEFKTKSFSELSTLEKLIAIDQLLLLKDKTLINNKVEDLLFKLMQENREQLLSDSNDSSLKNLELLHKSYVMMKKNTSKRLVLENLVFNLL